MRLVASFPDPSGVLCTVQDKIQSPLLKAGGARPGSCDVPGILSHKSKTRSYSASNAMKGNSRRALLKMRLPYIVILRS